jgi:phage terminase large subunit-like protein
MSNITEDQLKKMYRLSNDTAFRIQNTLKIKDKEGIMSPFVFNEVQKFIQESLEDQKKRTGRVRAIILKGRKQGCSTLVAGRFYDRMMREDGIESFILAHREDTVDTLYDIARRF